MSLQLGVPPLDLNISHVAARNNCNSSFHVFVVINATSFYSDINWTFYTSLKCIPKASLIKHNYLVKLRRYPHFITKYTKWLINHLASDVLKSDYIIFVNRYTYFKTVIKIENNFTP